jgi:predicted enzyme related to lactoylglutathione lyase
VTDGELTTPPADWPRPIVHWEIVARNPQGLATFYRQLFHWDIGEGAVMQVAPGLGGPEPGPAGHLRAGDHVGISLYVQVRDLEESIRLARTLGGKLVRAPFDASTGTTLAIILDPEDNRVVLVQQ